MTRCIRGNIDQVALGETLTRCIRGNIDQVH